MARRMTAKQKLTILRMQEGDPNLSRLPDYTERFGASVNRARKLLEEGMRLPEGGVVCLSTNQTRAAGYNVYFFLSTGASNNAPMRNNLKAENKKIKPLWSFNMANRIMRMQEIPASVIDSPDGHNGSKWDRSSTLELLQATSKYLIAGGTPEEWEQVSKAIGLPVPECQSRLAQLQEKVQSPTSRNPKEAQTTQTEAMRKCLCVMAEIAKKQRSLVDDFRYVSRRFMSALTDAAETCILTQDEVSVIFRNWDSVSEVHTELLHGVQIVDTRDRTVQKWLPKMITQFQRFFSIITKPMREFAPGALRAEQLVLMLNKTNKVWRSFMDSRKQDAEAMSHGGSAPRTLQSFLISPIQYLCRYTLLLKELLRCLQKVVEEQRQACKDASLADWRCCVRAFASPDARSDTTATEELVHLQSFLAELKDVPNRVQVTRNILQFWVSSNPRLSPDWVDPRSVSACKALIDQSDKVNIDVNLEVHNRKTSEDQHALLSDLTAAGVRGSDALLAYGRTFEMALEYKWISTTGGRHLPVPGVKGVFCYSDFVAVVVQPSFGPPELRTFMHRDILVSQVEMGRKCKCMINSHKYRRSTLKQYIIKFESSEICRKFCSHCTICRVDFFDKVDSCPFWMATNPHVPIMEILPESLSAEMCPKLAPECVLFPESGQLVARVAEVPLRIRNLPFMAASSKKIKKALRHRQKMEGKTISQEKTFGVVTCKRKKVLVRGAPRLENPKQIKVASLKNGAKVEILGRIQALDNPDCTFLQIQPSGKKNSSSLKYRWVGYVEPEFVKQELPSPAEARDSLVEPSADSGSTNDCLVFKANKTLQLFVIWPASSPPDPWLREDFVRLTGTSSGQHALTSPSVVADVNRRRMPTAELAQQSDPCVSVNCNGVLNKYHIYESRSPAPPEEVVSLAVPTCPSRKVVNKDFNAKEAQQYNFAVAFNFLDVDFINKETRSSTPSMRVHANPATANALTQRGTNQKAAQMLLTPKDGALSPKSNVSRPRSDAEDFGLLSPYLELNPPASGKLAALMGFQSSDSSLTATLLLH